MGLKDVRTAVAIRDPKGFESLLDELVRRARTDPRQVLAEAHKRGLPISGRTIEEQVTSLRRLHPAALDPVARAFLRTNSLAAGAQGFVTGLGGLATLPIAMGADTVGVLYWIVRATSAVMAAYGFENASEQGTAQLRIGLLAATGVNSVAVGGTSVAVSELSRQLLANPASARVVALGTRQLLRNLGVGATRGRLARTVPVLGGAVGGALNASLVGAVGRRTRRHYRGLLESWQAAQPAFVELPPPPPAALEG